MERDMPGTNPGKESRRSKFVCFHHAGIPADRGQRMGVRTGDEGLTMLMCPARGPQIWVHTAREPLHMDDAPFHCINAVSIGVDVFAQATGMGIKGMGRQHKHLRFARAQRPYLAPSRFAGQIAFRYIQNHDMLPVHIGFDARNKKNVSFAGVGKGFGDRTNLLMPSHRNRVESYSLRLVDMLKQAVSQIGINRVALAMTMQFNAIRWHALQYARKI